MYGAEDPSIAGMVLDSPFSDLVDLMMELVDTYKVRLPKFTVSILYYFFRVKIVIPFIETIYPNVEFIETIPFAIPFIETIPFIKIVIPFIETIYPNIFVRIM
jgi:hypothetical protein